MLRHFRGPPPPFASFVAIARSFAEGATFRQDMWDGERGGGVAEIECAVDRGTLELFL